MPIPFSQEQIHPDSGLKYFTWCTIADCIFPRSLVGTAVFLVLVLDTHPFKKSFLRAD